MEEKKKEKEKKHVIIYYNFRLYGLLLLGCLGVVLAVLLFVLVAAKCLYGEWAPLDFLLPAGGKLLLVGAMGCTLYWLTQWEYYDDY